MSSVTFCFRANIFFRNYEIKSDSDRTLIYITLYIQECFKKIQKVWLEKSATVVHNKNGIRHFCTTNLTQYYKRLANRHCLLLASMQVAVLPCTLLQG